MAHAFWLWTLQHAPTVPTLVHTTGTCASLLRGNHRQLEVGDVMSVCAGWEPPPLQHVLEAVLMPTHLAPLATRHPLFLQELCFNPNASAVEAYRTTYSSSLGLFVVVSEGCWGVERHCRCKVLPRFLLCLRVHCHQHIETVTRSHPAFVFIAFPVPCPWPLPRNTTPCCTASHLSMHRSPRAHTST